ncbi:MAG: hypothetical protein ACM3X6_03835 [Patescibacteria group bacterium]
MSGASNPPAELAAAIGRLYGLTVAGIEPVRSAWRLSTDLGCLYVKRTAAPPDILPFIVGLHDHLARAAPGLAPAVLRATDGAAHLDWAGHKYLVLCSLAGREADYYRDGDLAAVAAGLRHLHSAARHNSLSPPGKSTWYGTWPFRLKERLADLDRFVDLAKARGGPFDLAYRRLWHDYRPQAAAALAKIGGGDYRRQAAAALAEREICHHDLSHRNVLIFRGRAGFLDLDYAVADSVLHDLANLAGHLLRLRTYAFHPVDAALASYYGGARPEREAMEILGAMLLWPQDYWQIGRQRYDERQPWSEERFLALLARKCGQPRSRLRFFRRFGRAYGLRGGSHWWEAG